MKTDQLIAMLAQGAGAAPRAPVARRLGPASLAGVLASAALALSSFGPLPTELWQAGAPWFKLAYALAGALAAGGLALRLASPVPRARGPAGAVLAVGIVVAAIGLDAAWIAPAGQRLGPLLGHSWLQCPFSVLALSLPALAGGLWALRAGAVTRPRAAGAAVGLLAGALGAAGYALACTELALSFVALWYSLGMALAAALGAALGPRVLRW